MATRNKQPRPFRLKVIAGCAVAALAASDVAVAQITDCAGLCPDASAYCPITSPREVAPNTFIDCSTKDILVGDASGSITVDGGIFALKAHSLVVAAGHKIKAMESTTVAVGVEIEVDEHVSISGVVQALNKGRNSHVSIKAGKDISLYGNASAIDVSGDAESCDGGLVYLDAGEDVLIGSRIDANGKDGGDVDNINSGGLVQITAAGEVFVSEEIRAHGRFYNGGIVDILSNGSITVLWNTNTIFKGMINVEGRSLDGYGGYISLFSENAVTISGPIYAGGGVNNAGGFSQGGVMDIYAGCAGTVITDEIDLRGGSDGGGSLRVDSYGPVTISGKIYAQSRNHGGDGGTVELVSGKLLKLELPAMIDVSGHDTTSSGEDGEGGVAVLQGCQVEVVDDATTGAYVAALGAKGGAIIVEGSKSLSSTSDYSVRVGDKSAIDASGATVAGTVGMNIGQQRVGKCSNNATAPCQTDEECVFGCSGVGTCNNPIPNPDTQGKLNQFHPVPTIRQARNLVPCVNFCN